MAMTAKIPTHLRTLGAASALALLAACASVPPPTGLVQRAQQQLEAARDAQADDYAPVDMTFAEQRLQAAQAAMNAGKYAQARDMANESLADGRLAQTRAELAVARKEIKARSAENKRLRQQLLAPPESAAPARPAPPASNNSGLPEEIMLPQPQEPAPAAGDGSTGRPAPQGDQP